MTQNSKMHMAMGAGMVYVAVATLRSILQQHPVKMLMTDAEHDQLKDAVALLDKVHARDEPPKNDDTGTLNMTLTRVREVMWAHHEKLSPIEQEVYKDLVRMCQRRGL